MHAVLEPVEPNQVGFDNQGKNAPQSQI